MFISGINKTVTCKHTEIKKDTHGYKNRGKTWILHNTIRRKKPLKKSVVFAALIASPLSFMHARGRRPVLCSCYRQLFLLIGFFYCRRVNETIVIICVSFGLWTAIAAAAAIDAVSSCFALFVISVSGRDDCSVQCVFMFGMYIAVCLSVCLRWFALFATRIDLTFERCNVDVGAWKKRILNAMIFCRTVVSLDNALCVARTQFLFRLDAHSIVVPPPPRRWHLAVMLSDVCRVHREYSWPRASIPPTAMTQTSPFPSPSFPFPSPCPFPSFPPLPGGLGQSPQWRGSGVGGLV